MCCLVMKHCLKVLWLHVLMLKKKIDWNKNTYILSVTENNEAAIFNGSDMKNRLKI